MPRKKAEPKATPTPKAKPKAPSKPKVKKFVSVTAPQFHPFQRVNIPLGGSTGVILEEDSWTLCQVEAGIIKEI